MISAFMIEDRLKKTGNAFVVNAALSDLLISGLLVPISAVVLLAGADDSIALCRFQWFLASTSFLVTAFTMALIAGENLSRAYPDRPSNEVLLTPARCACSITLVWLACVLICSAPQIMKNQETEEKVIVKGKTITIETLNDGFAGLDYCARRFRKLGRRLDDVEETRAGPIVLLVTVCAPCFIALLLHMWARHRVSKEQQRICSRGAEHKSPSGSSSRLGVLQISCSHDPDLARANLAGLCAFLMCWLPFGACLVPEPNLIPDAVLYNMAWLAYSRSCLNPLLYCALDGRFRNAYVNLFHYCCCKTTVSFSRRQRGGGGSNSGAGDSRGYEGGLGRSGGDVRVHIIPGYNMYSYTSPQRPCRQNGRDVYEL